MRRFMLRAATLTVALGAGQVFAGSIASVESQASGTPATIGDTTTPVISAILSSPVGSLDGYNYTSYAMLANDGTGSIDVFGKLPNGSPTPVVGDTVGLTGTYSPFDSIPEIESLSAFSEPGTAAVPAPSVFTIPQVNAATASSYNILEYVVQLNDVYLGFGTPATWPTHANENFNIVDAANDSLPGFFWASSYATDGAMGGTAAPIEEELDMTGFLSIFSGTPQFTPLTFTVVPEPASVGLLAIGALGLLRRRRNA